MKVTLGGVRGSCPVAQPDYMKYGGETTSILIEGDAGERILVDGGTGIRLLGQQVMKSPGEKAAWLFMTHYHLDHVSGLPMLPMLYDPDWRLTLAAPDHHQFHFHEIMARILDEPFWPMQIEDLKSKNIFHHLGATASTIPYACGSIDVRWCPVHHPGGCTAYRFDEPATGASVVFATDVEWGLSTPEEKESIGNLVSQPSPAKLLIMDGQYSHDQICTFRGWGHSTWQEALAFADRMHVKQLLLTHHDPSANDTRLDTIQAIVLKNAGWAGLARQGMVIKLPFEGARQQ